MNSEQSGLENIDRWFSVTVVCLTNMHFHIVHTVHVRLCFRQTVKFGTIYIPEIPLHSYPGPTRQELTGADSDTHIHLYQSCNYTVHVFMCILVQHIHTASFSPFSI